MSGKVAENTSAAPVATHENMAAFLKEDASPGEVEVKAEDVTEAKDEVKTEEVETKSDSDDDAEKDASSKQDEDKKDKPNRYQRLKLRAEAAQAEVRKAREESNQALLIANNWRAEAKALRAELERVLGEAEQAGYKRSSKDAELFEAQRKLQQKELNEEFTKATSEQEMKRELEDTRNQMITDFKAESAELAQKYSVDQGDLLRAYAIYFDSGKDVPMEEVAASLATLESIRKKQSHGEAVKQQHARNASAPKPIRTNGVSAPVDYKPDMDGMKAFLMSQGKS
jgi:hypothetical protein